MDPLDPANVCVHLTGIGPTACHAGVDYDSVKAGTRRPEWPCTNLAVPCAARLLPAAQLAANQKWFDELAEQGVRIVHPDDGWVDHEANTIRFVYPTMQHALPAPGVLVALGTRERWRVVMLTREVLQPVGMSSLWAFVEERPAVAEPDVDDEARALGERWIHAGGRLLPGMLLLYSAFYAEGRDADDQWWGRVSNPADVHRGQVPDLRDPATRGAALDVVRERHSLPHLSLSEALNGGREVWCWAGMSRRVVGFGASEAEALVAALEIAT